MSELGIVARRKSKLLIFDLDMCILDTTTLGADVIDPVLEVLHSSSVPLEVQKALEKDLWTMSLQDACDKHGVPEPFRSRMWDAYRQLEVPDTILTFGDEVCLSFLPVTKVLVTSGFRRFQQSKIDRLGIASLFDDIIIDAIDEPKKRKGEARIFALLMRVYGLTPVEVMVIGDSASSELKAGQELGMYTTQTLRPGVTLWPEADHHIRSFTEL